MPATYLEKVPQHCQDSTGRPVSEPQTLLSIIACSHGVYNIFDIAYSDPS